MATLAQIKVGSTTYDINNRAYQENSTANSDYRVLLSGTADDTSRTEGEKKSTNFKANPSTGKFRATSFNVADHVTQQYNSTTQALDFIFS